MSRTLLLGLILLPAFLHCQPDSIHLPVVPLEQLVDEALLRNPEIQAALHQMSVVAERVPQVRGLPDPELTYMREQMPGFHWSEAMMQKLELMQMIRFPSKVAAQTDLAQIQAEHAHHDHLEKINEVIGKLKTAYVELWYAQKAQVLGRENLLLLQQLAEIARTRYSVGSGPLQDALKASVEVGKAENQLAVLAQRERGAIAMIRAFVDRPPADTLGRAVLSEVPVFTPTIDTLQALALQLRPMLQHDSMVVEESRTMLSLAKREYLPDLKLGVQYVTFPAGDFHGWSVVAGITLPFAPWTLGKASGRVEEATATVNRSASAYRSSRSMVLASVRDLYARVQSAQQRIRRYRTSLLPEARESLRASFTAYQTGKADYLMMIDANRMYIDLSMEALMARMEFEQALAELERAVGDDHIAAIMN
jgi:outer membrane protein TolC